jgi:hypothetical protein
MRACVVCGKEFTPRNSRQVTCGKVCSRQHMLNRKREWGSKRVRDLERKNEAGRKRYATDSAFRERQLAANRLVRERPEYRELNCERCRRMRQDPEFRERERERFRRMRQDPEGRERTRLATARSRHRKALARMAEQIRTFLEYAKCQTS